MHKRGLTHILPRLFFPKLSLKRLAQRPKNVGGLKKSAARARGRRVDSDLARLTREAVLALNATLEARIIFTFIKRMRARVVGAQVKVANAHWDALTYLDLLLKTENDENVVVEVKRGCIYRDCRVPKAYSQHLEPQLPVKPRHLHEVQALAGARLWELQEKQKVHDVWLLYVDEATLEFTRRAQFGVRWSESAERAIIHRNKKKKKK
jgi:hypothetical protein